MSSTKSYAEQTELHNRIGRKHMTNEPDKKQFSSNFVRFCSRANWKNIHRSWLHKGGSLLIKAPQKLLHFVVGLEEFSK